MGLEMRYHGRRIKNTKRIVQRDGPVFIRVTFEGEKFKPGPQELISEPEYQVGRIKTYVHNR